jgi:hypothetical protein
MTFLLSFKNLSHLIVCLTVRYTFDPGHEFSSKFRSRAAQIFFSTSDGHVSPPYIRQETDLQRKQSLRYEKLQRFVPMAPQQPIRIKRNRWPS